MNAEQHNDLMGEVRELSEDDKTFLLNYTRWECGSTFDIDFYCEKDYDLEDFAALLFLNPTVRKFNGPEMPEGFEAKDNYLLLCPAEWPVTIGAIYSKCDCKNCLENHILKIFFYPYHIQRLCGEFWFQDDVKFPELVFLFIKHLLKLVKYVSQQIHLKRVIFYHEGDSYPVSEENGIFLYTWLTRMCRQWFADKEINETYSLLQFQDIGDNNFPTISSQIQSFFNEHKQKTS